MIAASYPENVRADREAEDRAADAEISEDQEILRRAADVGFAAKAPKEVAAFEKAVGEAEAARDEWRARGPVFCHVDADAADAVRRLEALLAEVAVLLDAATPGAGGVFRAIRAASIADRARVDAIARNMSLRDVIASRCREGVSPAIDGALQRVLARVDVVRSTELAVVRATDAFEAAAARREHARESARRARIALERRAKDAGVFDALFGHMTARRIVRAAATTAALLLAWLVRKVPNVAARRTVLAVAAAAAIGGGIVAVRSFAGGSGVAQRGAGTRR